MTDVQWGRLLADAQDWAGTVSRWRGVDADDLVGDAMARAVEFHADHPDATPDEIWREISRGVDAAQHAEQRARSPKVVRNQSSERERLTAAVVAMPGEVAVDDDPSAQMVAEETRQEWMAAYMHIANFDSRRAIVMRNSGATLDQIAKAMKSDKSKARRRLANGMKIMRAHLDE